MTSRRIELLDAARGFCLLVMLLHHTVYDLVTMMGVSGWLFYSPAVNYLEYFFAGLFILISGVSSRFSKSNIKRSFKVILGAIIISVVTTLFGMPVVFGILHFLGFSMLFYGLTNKLWEKINGIAAPLLYCGLTAASAVFLKLANPVKIPWLWFLGLWTNEFASADYFPIFPWIFVFLLGTWFGKVIKEGKLPDWFYNTKPPLLPQIGRKSMLIYMLHQPIIVGILMSVKWLFKL
jgi:uncharacterized membrane protein